MGAPDIIAHLHAFGVNLTLRGDKLIAAPADLVTPEILGMLRAHKPKLLAALKATTVQPTSPDGSYARLQPSERHSRDPVRIHAIAEVVPDARSEARRTRVLELLERNSTVKYACVTDLGAVPGVVVLTVAIRGQSSFDLHIPDEKWDGTLFVDLLERHSGTVH